MILLIDGLNAELFDDFIVRKLKQSLRMSVVLHKYPEILKLKDSPKCHSKSCKTLIKTNLCN